MSIYSGQHQDNIDTYRRQAVQVLDHLSVVSQRYTDFFLALKDREDAVRQNISSPSSSLIQRFCHQVTWEILRRRYQAIEDFEREYAAAIAIALSTPGTIATEKQQEILGQYRELGVPDIYQTEDWEIDFRNGLNWLITAREKWKSDLEKGASVSPAAETSGLSAFQEKIDMLRAQHCPVWEAAKHYHEAIQKIVGPAHGGLTGYLREDTHAPQILERLPDLLMQAEAFLAREVLSERAVQGVLEGLRAAFDDYGRARQTGSMAASRERSP